MAELNRNANAKTEPATSLKDIVVDAIAFPAVTSLPLAKLPSFPGADPVSLGRKMRHVAEKAGEYVGERYSSELTKTEEAVKGAVKVGSRIAVSAAVPAGEALVVAAVKLGQAIHDPKEKK